MVAFKKAKTNLSASLRKCKQLSDKIEGDFDPLTDDCENMVVHGYPEAMAIHFKKKIQELRAEKDEMRSLYVTVTSKPEKRDVAEHDLVLADTQDLDLKTKAMEKTYKEFNKGTAFDIKRLGAKAES